MPKKPKPFKTSQSSPIAWSIIVTAILLIIFSLFVPTTPASKVQPYSKFIDLVESDRIEKVTIGSSHINSKGMLKEKY